MPAADKIAALPAAVRERLDALVVEKGFGDYAGLADRLSSQGHPMRKAMVARHGKALRRCTASAKRPVSGFLPSAAGPNAGSRWRQFAASESRSTDSRASCPNDGRDDVRRSATVARSGTLSHVVAHKYRCATVALAARRAARLTLCKHLLT